MNMNTRIGHLHFWCQKVLPLVYDNSLSYYEVLLKLKNKLNEVIDYTNQIPEYIDEKVKESFNEEHLRELISEVFRTIEDAISANNEGTNTHFDNDYEIGDLLWHDNKFYKVTRHIDAGDTVLVDTNIELVNFADMFNDFIAEVKTRFTDNDDGDRETSTMDRPVHDLVWLHNELYEVIKPIAEGNAYIFTGANKNVENTNLDKIYDYLLDLISSEIDARERADDTLQDNIDAEALAREQGDDTLQGNIDAEALAREQEDDTLQGNIDAEALAREQADDDFQSKIGNLSDLVTTAKNNLVSAINETFNLPKGVYVNVRDYGANGNTIYYNKADNHYYADAEYTTVPPSDVTAFENAIADALANNKKYIYIPAGYYYLPNKTFGLNEQLTFIGEGNSYLISEGLSGDVSFINITVTTQMIEYSASLTLLEGITILGNYFNGTRKTNSNGVVAVSVGDAWVQHRNIVNVGVANFDVGFKFRAAVETHMAHCSVFLCNVGIAFNENNGGYNPVPFFFENGTIELNGTGILAPNGGYSTIHIINSGYSGGRLPYYGKSNLYITGCRMEYALDALCADDGVPNAAIEIYATSGTDADAGLMIDNCEILTTASGYWDAIDLFVNVTHKTRIASKKYLFHIYQPYGGQSCDAMINNSLYNVGDEPVPILCYAEGGTVAGKIRSTISANHGTMLGSFTMNAKALGKYTNITDNGGTGISVSADTTITIPLTTNDSGVIAHLPINENIVHRYLANNAEMQSYTIMSSSSNYFNSNTASRKPIGADAVQIVIPDGYYGEAWIEVI